MMEAMFNTAVDSGAGDQSGQACIDQMNNKGWQEISTNKRGEKEYYVVGVGSVPAIQSKILLAQFRMQALKLFSIKN